MGAGMAGLAAAARMASRGNDVVVCEASAGVGGALRAWRDGELSFELGAHTLTLPAAYRDLFIKTGSRKKSAAASLEDRVDLRPLDPVRRYLFPDGARVELPNSSRGRLVAAFDDALGAGAGAAWLRVVDHGSRAWDAIRPTLVESPGSGGREVARLLRTAEGRRALTPLRRLRTLAGAWFAGADPRLLLLLDDYARQAGADPRRAPGVVAARVYIEQAFGAWRIVGGMHRLGEALHQRVLDRGVEVRLKTVVERVEVAGVAVTGVRLASGERLHADVVIAAVDRAVLARLLTSRARMERKPRRKRKGSYSAASTTICLAVDESPEMPHETVLLDEDGPAIRIHVAAEQPTAWTVHAPVNQPIETVLAGLAARGFDVRGKARVVHVMRPADWEAATGVPGGGAYGPAVDDLRSALLRSPVGQKTRGLFHVGASARPGSGLSFAALSAWQGAELAKSTLGRRPASAADRTTARDDD